ncbi:hypothetical protein [Actinacidiphila glaucinigra]|uniref:hypothetical protein n=1 Tax=Actinacidiphila glaucinigra TaxID=235986 RepID=UPI002E355CF0|nr:hypothetical protein [Actinacidiphila glaucinigra]
MTTYDPTTTAALLDAGAVLPPGTTTREDADTLTVRTYTHPVLDDRRVVRLVPGTLGEAEDLALDFLGLTRQDEAPEVGQVRRETLGFPAWALVNDPANGHHALALVKDVERLARMAKSRAGAAKDGFDALAERLGRAVPHFLPTFHEQAARVFLQHENTTYAAAFFGKARAAERVHGLAVDEDRQRAVFLEFAFAGALTVKALKEHVKDLARRLDPAEAWRQFRQLTVERCAAGMPPYASLPQDARSLIKAAGLDRVTEECALVADLVASPAVVRAPGSFWTSYRATLAVLAEREPAVRARLLEIMPAGIGRDAEGDEFWLALLAETGADTLLTGEAGEAARAVDAADWLSRWASHRKHGSASADRSPATLALVARMAPRLRADGRPVDLFEGRWHAGAELDLLDLCAAERVPLTVPAEDVAVHLPLHRWLDTADPARSDLAATAADPRLRRLLHKAVGNLGEDRGLPGVLEALAGHPVLGDVLREWLDEAAGQFTRAAGLPAARTAISRLRPFRSVAARVNPAAVARVAGHEIAPLLARTLREGILDELGWPALDEGLRLLDAAVAQNKDNTLIVAEAWPALILARGDKAVVVGPDKVLLDHDLRIPVALDRWNRPRFRWADDELLVMWWKDGKQSGYWSARPSEVFTLGGEQLPHGWHGHVAAPSIPLPGGGRATGGRTLHAGDTVLPPSRPVLGDGTTLWRQGKQGRHQVWMEYDPATGTHGRASLPAFLRSGILDGARLSQEDCEVLPLQPGLEQSPFGTDGTVLGRWVRVEGEGEGEEARTVAGTPDGRTVAFPTRKRKWNRCVPLGALRLPGGAEPLVALTHQKVSLYAAGDVTGDDELGSVTLTEQGGEFAAGMRYVPTLAYWHALRPRDERASAVLRALTDEEAAELLRVTATALAERQAEASRTKKYTGPTSDEVARAAVTAVLPGLTDERLLIGVTALVRGTLRHAESAASFIAPPDEGSKRALRRSEGMFADYKPQHGDDTTLRSATEGIADQRSHSWWGGGPRWSVLRQIRAVNHVLSGKEADGKPLPDRAKLGAPGGGWRSEEHTVPGIGMVWLSVLAVLRPLAYRAAAPVTGDTAREGLLLLFDAITEGPLAVPGAGLREIVLGEKHDRQQRAGQVLRKDGRTVVILGCKNVDGDRNRVNWLALDHDPTGAFGAVAHFTLEDETDRAPVFPAERLAAVARLIRDKGAAPWRPDTPGVLAAATGGGLGPVQATLLLAGRPQEADAEALALINLKPAQRNLGNGLLSPLSQQDHAALVGALLPDDPAALWSSGPDTAAAGRVWEERLGSVVRLPEDVAAELAGVPAASAEAVLNPTRTPWLSRTTVQRPDKDGDLVPADPSALPGRYDITRSVAVLAGLAYGLPYGHPLRTALPEGLAALRRRVADPGLLLDLDVAWTEKGGPTAVQIRQAHGLPATGGADAHGLTHVGDALVLRPWYGDTETVLVRPAGLTGPEDSVFGLVEGLVGTQRAGGIQALRTVLGDELARAVAADGEAGAPAGHAQDPTFSVPALVTEVAAFHGLSEDAAALYLQLLALPDPTDRDCARWTGWKPARMKKARAELAATALVVEAKRSRAGRTLFLPCGWRDLKAPAVPVETWKEGLYPVRDHTRVVPLLPVPELFARAWERVRAGDAPAFEELTTRATRKGRRR